MKTSFTVLLFLLFNQLCSGQNDYLDSLKNQLKGTKHDTVQINTYLMLGDYFENTSFDSVLYFYNQALILAEKNIEMGSIPLDEKDKRKYKSLQVIALRYIGVTHFDMGNFDKAISYYLKSLKVATEINDIIGECSCYNNIGNVH